MATQRRKIRVNRKFGAPRPVPVLLSFKSTPPPEREVIIVEKERGKRAQVTIRDGVAYLWEYKDTDKVFCLSSDVLRWRGCTGFDF